MREEARARICVRVTVLLIILLYRWYPLIIIHNHAYNR